MAWFRLSKQCGGCAETRMLRSKNKGRRPVRRLWPFSSQDMGWLEAQVSQCAGELFRTYFAAKSNRTCWKNWESVPEETEPARIHTTSDLASLTDRLSTQLAGLGTGGAGNNDLQDNFGHHTVSLADWDQWPDVS